MNSFNHFKNDYCSSHLTRDSLCGFVLISFSRALSTRKFIWEATKLSKQEQKNSHTTLATNNNNRQLFGVRLSVAKLLPASDHAVFTLSIILRWPNQWFDYVSQCRSSLFIKAIFVSFHQNCFIVSLFFVFFLFVFVIHLSLEDTFRHNETIGFKNVSSGITLKF